MMKGEGSNLASSRDTDVIWMFLADELIERPKTTWFTKTPEGPVHWRILGL